MSDQVYLNSYKLHDQFISYAQQLHLARDQINVTLGNYSVLLIIVCRSMMKWPDNGNTVFKVISVHSFLNQLIYFFPQEKKNRW